MFRKIKSMNIKITSKVLFEIKSNLQKVVDGSFEEFDKKIAELIPYTNIYQGCIFEDENEVIELYEDELKKYTSYSKMNGEFCSVICSSVLNRTQKNKAIFFTDDYKAKEDFAQYFAFHQIGYIEDSIDLIVFLFSSDKLFKVTTLLRILSNLRSRYLSDHASVLKQLRKRYNDLSFKDKEEKLNINNLIKSLSNMDIKNARKVFENLNHKKNKDLFKLINQYNSLFEIENDYVNKIIQYERYFKNEEIFSLYE